MLTTIQLNDKFLFNADEIGDINSNGMLPSEIDAQLIVTNLDLEFALGRSKFFSEFDGAGSGCWIASR